MKHHTKDKGDRGLGQVIASLMQNGLSVAVLLSEHLPYDCIAISGDGVSVKRVSVKYRSVTNGRIKVDLCSTWSDKHGHHKRPYKESDFDCLAVFCPDTDSCYYVNAKEIGNSHSVSLRVKKPKNNQHKGILMADEFGDPCRMFC